MNYDERKKPRYDLSLEAEDMIQQEQEKRKELGLPHTKRIILSEWVIAMGRRLGYKFRKGAATE